MKLPDRRKLLLNDGVLVEPVSDGDHGDRIVLWIPGTRDGEFQLWHRIWNVPRAPITQEQGILATAATSIRARQRLDSIFGKLCEWFRKKSDRNWILPNGESAEQVGDRQTDLVLLWPENGNRLDESQIKNRWPQSTQVQRLGDNLFLVSRATSAIPPTEADPASDPRAVAERMLMTARKTDDRRAAVSALIVPFEGSDL